jgi:hypothetical protein
MMMAVHCRGRFHFNSEESSAIHHKGNGKSGRVQLLPSKKRLADINPRRKQDGFCCVMATEEMKFEGAAGADWNASAADLDGGAAGGSDGSRGNQRHNRHLVSRPFKSEPKLRYSANWHKVGFYQRHCTLVSK